MPQRKNPKVGSRRNPYSSTGRRAYSASHARRTSRRVQEHTVGTHVKRRRAPQKRGDDVTEAIRRRAMLRRIFAGVAAVVIVVGAALLMGNFAFRSTVGSSMALKDSNAADALKTPEAGKPYYTLIATDLGSVAEPLDNPGPDALLLARVDNAGESLALINIPANLQVSSDGKTTTLSNLALKGDAELIEAVTNFTKLDIAHYIKLDEEGLSGLVDGLGGIDVEIEQVIDDPHAGDVYLPKGPHTLNGPTALMYLRADNLKQGTKDQLSHQLDFAALVIQKLMGSDFGTKIDTVGGYLQTDCSYGDLDAVASWMKNKSARDIVVTSLPGYMTAITSVDDTGEQRYIGSYDDFAEIIEILERGGTIQSNDTDTVESVASNSFTVDVQNGTSISGAAAITSELLADKGFNVGDVGNAEQQVYEETLVVYKDPDKGLSQAKAVIEALGVGRPVSSSEYYTFDHDVLLIIGGDYSPVN